MTDKLSFFLASIRDRLSSKRRTHEHIEWLNNELVRTQHELNNAQRELEAAEERAEAERRLGDAWRDIFQTLRRAKGEKVHTGEAKIAYVPFMTDFPFPRDVETAKFIAAQSGQRLDAIIPVVYHVGENVQ